MTGIPRVLPNANPRSFLENKKLSPEELLGIIKERLNHIGEETQKRITPAWDEHMNKSGRPGEDLEFLRSTIGRLQGRLIDACTLNSQLVEKNEVLKDQLEKEKDVDRIRIHDIADELWREYDFGGRIYRIEQPKTLYYHPRGTTHRVLDCNNVVHCVPAPGILGCVLRWEPANPEYPVRF